MYDPWSLQRREHKNWGHAVSDDCIHWRELPPILDTLIDHKPGSGSGVVDWNDSSGFRRGIEKPLIVFYTDYGRGTCLAYSNDRGRTWLRYKGNPVLQGTEDIRDPYVFWYKPAHEWRLARYEKRGFAFYASSNLVKWTFLSRIDGFYECPDLCHLPVDGNPDNKKWALIDGDGTYVIGHFDGTRFQPETEKLRVNYGRLYATQTWKQTVEGDGPVAQMAFVGYVREPRRTWIGQMCFPCELTLRTCPQGVRLYRYPLNAIKGLYAEQLVWDDLRVAPGDNPLDGVAGDLFDIRAEIEIAQAHAFGFEVRGERIRYLVEERTLSWRDAPTLEPVNNRVKLRILVDRSSIEIFGNDGRLSLTNLFFPDPSNENLGLFAEGGDIRVVSLEVNRLESIWQEKNLSLGHFGPLSPAAG